MAAGNYILHFFSEQPLVRLSGLTTDAQTLPLFQRGSFLRQPSSIREPLKGQAEARYGQESDVGLGVPVIPCNQSPSIV